MKHISFLPLVLFVVVLSACSGGQSRRAVATEGRKAAAAPTQGSVVYNADVATSLVRFVGSKPTGKHTGAFRLSDGEVHFSDGQLSAASFTVDVQSLVIEDIPQDHKDNAKLRGHLLSEDFFDAAKHPTATFSVTGASVYEAGGEASGTAEGNASGTGSGGPAEGTPAYTHNISGNLTMRGVSKNITFPAVVVVDEGNFSLTADLTIDRTDWGIVYGDQRKVKDQVTNKFIYNKVPMSVSLRARVSSGDGTTNSSVQ